jgi:hypothetical protein
MDSKCTLSAEPDEQMVATSCLKLFGPDATTLILDPLHSARSISAREIKTKQSINFHELISYCTVELDVDEVVDSVVALIIVHGICLKR